MIISFYILLSVVILVSVIYFNFYLNYFIKSYFYSSTFVYNCANVRPHSHAIMFNGAHDIHHCYETD